MTLQAVLSVISPNAPGDMEYSVATLPGWAMSGLVEPEAGWLLCNGAVISNSGKYVNLYAILAALGHPFGANGKLPTLIDGVQPAAQGSTVGSPGATRGASAVTLTLAQLAGHIHSYNDYWAALGVNTDNGMGDNQTGSYDFYESTDAQGGGGSHNNMPPYVVVEGMMVKL